jgi:TonB family protein
VKSVSGNHTPSETLALPVEDDDEDPLIYYYSETMPEFPGGPDSLHAYLSRTIQYPQDARDKGVSGTVLAEFVVEKDGRVGQVTIKVPLFPSCDEEVVRVLQLMPLWKPATNQGQPIRCFFSVPVTFRNDTSLEGGD